VQNPFARLDQANFRALAQRLDITTLLLARFRDRAIDVTSIPQRFIQKLSIELE